MINDWNENINNRCLVGCITLDFRKSFDVLSHEILIQKLALYGCDDISLSWFDSYLKNRSQLVQIENVNSSFESIKFGVPQGSILGPLLFIVFINDIVFETKYITLLYV